MEKKERLDKVVSNMGFGTRSQVKKYIRKGMVTVNGEVELNNSLRLNPYKNKIFFNGQDVNYREHIYLLMNKPQGFVSSTEDPSSRTVIEILEYEHQIFDPFPVGRLDKDTEGLLLISNDGKLAHELLSPKNKVDKVYFAEVLGKVEEEHIEKFKEGVILDDGYKTLPGDLEIIESGTVSKINLTIHEGKFHQVKRMFESIGMEVIYLQRIRMGPLELEGFLEPGEYRELTEEEIKTLKNF